MPFVSPCRGSVGRHGWKKYEPPITQSLNVSRSEKSASGRRNSQGEHKLAKDNQRSVAASVRTPKAGNARYAANTRETYV